MQYHSLAGIASGALGIISFFPYLRSILNGETKPHRTTYGIWSFVGTVELVSYIASGATTTIILPLVFLLCEIAIFILSFKRGMGGTTKLDILCLVGAILGVIGWVITRNPEVALYLSISASLCGFIPTVKKTYLYPKTENTLAWSIAAGAAILNLLAISHWTLNIIAYPLYIFAFDSITAFLTLFPNAFRKHKE